MGDFVTIEDQGPRDGFQTVRQEIPTALKLRVVAGLVEAGVRRVQVCSFVRTDLVPQMADAEALLAELPSRPEVTYSGLVLNERGIDRAVASGLGHVAVSLSASDTHGRKNARRGLEDSRRRIGAMIRRAKDAGLGVRGGIQCAFGCRYEGAIPEERVVGLAEELLGHGADAIALADSTGMGHPRLVASLAGAVVTRAKGAPVSLHLHDTEGKAMANALAGLDVGVRHFDTAFGGLGGCPFIRGASGNLPTEDLVVTLHQLGYETGVDPRGVARVSALIEEHLGETLPGRMHRVLRTEGMKVLEEGTHA